jgi:type IV secretory pathway protease TraF
MTQLGYGGSDTVSIPTSGTVINDSSSETLGFYGATPIARPSVTQQSTATTTALRADINRLETALVNLGLIAVT